MNHFLKLFSILFITLTSYAEEQISTTTINKGEYNNVADKFSLEFVAATEQIKDSERHEVNGLYTSLKTSLMYTLTEEDELRLYNSYVIEDYQKSETSKYFELLEGMYRRKGILNQADHGVSLDFEAKYAKVLDSKIRKYWGFDDEAIPQMILKRKFQNGFGVEFKARHHFYGRNKNKASTLSNEDRLYLSAYKMFNHSFIFNTELKYRHKIYTGAHFSHHRGGLQSKNHEDLVIHPGLMYFLSRQALLEGYFETKLNDTFDDRKTSTLMKDELILGAALYLTVF